MKRKKIHTATPSLIANEIVPRLDDIVQLTRRWNKKTTTPTLIVRRVGRATGRQVYCRVYCILDWKVSFMEKGTIRKNITWKDNQHSIRSDYYLKCYFKEETNLSLEELESLALYIDAHPEPGSENKQPPATTNRHLKQLISEGGVGAYTTANVHESESPGHNHVKKIPKFY
jgi:hypothetical protein